MRPIRSTKRLALTGFACLLSGLVLVPLQAAPAGAAPVPGELQSQTFSEVGKTLHFVVPADVPTIHIHVVGGSGGTGRTFCTNQGFVELAEAAGVAERLTWTSLLPLDRIYRWRSVVPERRHVPVEAERTAVWQVRTPLPSAWSPYSAQARETAGEPPTLRTQTGR